MTEEEIRALKAENESLLARCTEAEETLNAIRSGEVEALVIGDQVYMLESAEAASNRFRGHVLQQINDIVIGLDLDRRITYLNPAAENKYKVLASDVLGHTSGELFKVKWFNEGDKENAETTFQQEGWWHGECVHIPNNADEFCAEVTVSRLRDDDGSDAGMLAVIRDITARKQAENELREGHEKLEQRVKDRTLELANANLTLLDEMGARTRIEKQRTDLLQRIVSTQEDERRRIARDIHDQLGQRVTALRLQIAALGDSNGDSTSFDGKLEILKRTAMRLDSEIGFLAWELRPASLDDLGLPEAAKAFLDEWSHNYKISSEFNIRGFRKKRLSPEAETHLYRILQESLNNVSKHADATRVNVLLEWKPDEVALIVEDNGRGFEVEKAMRRTENGKGLGLLGMQERAVLVDGSVEIESSRGKGTTIYTRVPVNEQKPEKPTRKARARVT